VLVKKVIGFSKRVNVRSDNLDVGVHGMTDTR
jgi:hypothetical protein